MRPTPITPLLALTLLAAPAGAQHPEAAAHASHAAHRPTEGAPPPADGRQVVRFPARLKEETLANMRDHLLALQQIQAALGGGDYDRAAEIAERRLGMSSLPSHGAHEVAPHMPEGMKAAGSGMHRTASRFALAAKDAAVTGELGPALGSLAQVTAQCVACHAGYRFE